LFDKSVEPLAAPFLSDWQNLVPVLFVLIDIATNNDLQFID
jgi:hypothetical protein